MSGAKIGLILVSIALITQTIVCHLERRDLLNRIMCKDLNDYRKDGKTPVAPVSAHRKTLQKWRSGKTEGES